MNSDLQEHHNDEEILTINIRPEAELWKTELEFLSTEIDFLRKLVRSELVERTRSNPEDAKFLLQQLQAIMDFNNFQLKTIISYKVKLEGLRECDDLQCDTYFLKDHLVLKAAVQKHYQSVRTAKNYIYRFFANGFDQAG